MIVVRLAAGMSQGGGCFGKRTDKSFTYLLRLLEMLVRQKLLVDMLVNILCERCFLFQQVVYKSFRPGRSPIT